MKVATMTMQIYMTGIMINMDREVIQPLIRQHAANAAFYWHQKV